MKILHINCMDYGSTGKIIKDISTYLGEKHESVLCTPLVSDEENGLIKKYKTSLRFEQGAYRRVCYIYGLQFGFAPVSTWKILRAIRKEKPDVVHLHSINCNMVNIYKLVHFLKRRQIPTVVTNHAEFFYTGSCAYSYECDKWKTGCGECPDLYRASLSKHFDRTATAHKKMKRAFENAQNFCIVSVSPWVNNRAMESPILENLQHKFVLNGVNTDVFKPSDSAQLKEKLGIQENERVLFLVTAFFTDDPKNIKGGYNLIKLAERLKEKNIRIIVAGKYKACMDYPENMVLLGEVSDQKLLAAYYSLADLSVIVSKKETFSMPVAESLCCGTPIVGFKAGGPESIALKEYSKFVEYGNIDELECAVLEWIDFKKNHGYLDVAMAARERFSSDKMAEEYYKIYREIGEKD